jgi:hypothetical protein
MSTTNQRMTNGSIDKNCGTCEFKGSGTATDIIHVEYE